MNRYESAIAKLADRWAQEPAEDKADLWTRGYYSGQLSMIELMALHDPDVEVEDYQRILSATWETDQIIKKEGIPDEKS